MGRATALFFCPTPWGPGEGPKGQISINIIKFQLQSQFQRFLNQTLCVFSQMKDMKHIRWDFHLVEWVMRQGCVWGWGVKTKFPKFNQILCVSYLHEWHMQRHNILGLRPLGPWEGAKRSPNFVYLLTNERYITYQTGFSFGRLGHAQGWDLRVLWGIGSQNFFFFPKFNQISCVSYLQEWHMHQHNFFGPHPLGPWGGVKNLIF